MQYSYKTKGTCSQQIDIELDGDIIQDVTFYGGCNGNLKAIPALVKGPDLFTFRTSETFHAGGKNCVGREGIREA